MGGLVRQGKPGRLEATLRRALQHAAWCSSDPVCIESKGQGSDNSNLAACHGCCLLPETSCEEGNRLLDRALLVGTPEPSDLGLLQQTALSMADVFTKAKRSQVMSRIRGRGNKETEVVLARLLRQNKITGWRRHYRIIGRPDFAFPKLKLAVFVDGCFWHGCPKHSNLPVNNRTFWRTKLTVNKLRDRLVGRTLRSRGWSVLRVWEHELAPKRQEKLVRRIVAFLSQ